MGIDCSGGEPRAPSGARRQSGGLRHRRWRRRSPAWQYVLGPKVQIPDIHASPTRLHTQATAFHDPLSCEHRDDFRQAISDTQKALSTGELQDRKGRRLRRADGGWRTLNNDDYRKGLAGVADALQQFRVDLIEAERLGHVGQQGDWFMIHDPELQAGLERRREAVVVALDKVLRAAGLPPLRERR